MKILAGSRLFVTGGTGFFGKALLRHWKSRSMIEIPPKVTLLTRSIEKFKLNFPIVNDMPWIEFWQGDMCNYDTLPIGESFDYVIHAATESTFGPSISPLQRFDYIVNGCRNILEFAGNCRARRLLLTSSGAVYGKQPHNITKIPEDFYSTANPANVENAYALGKLISEHLCAHYSTIYKYETTIARCFAFVGQDLPLDAHFAIGNFILDALNNAEIQIKGDGRSVRSYLDQRDLAEWLLYLLAYGENQGVYNVGSDASFSLYEVAKTISDVFGLKKDILVQSNKDVVCTRYVPDISKVRMLGLVPKYDLKSSILNIRKVHE